MSFGFGSAQSVAALNAHSTFVDAGYLEIDVGPHPALFAGGQEMGPLQRPGKNYLEAAYMHNRRVVAVYFQRVTFEIAVFDICWELPLADNLAFLDSLFLAARGSGINHCCSEKQHCKSL